MLLILSGKHLPWANLPGRTPGRQDKHPQLSRATSLPRRDTSPSQGLLFDNCCRGRSQAPKHLAPVSGSCRYMEELEVKHPLPSLAFSLGASQPFGEFRYMELILVALCIPGHLRELREQSGHGKKERSSCFSGFTGISSRASPQH